MVGGSVMHRQRSFV